MWSVEVNVLSTFVVRRFAGSQFEWAAPDIRADVSSREDLEVKVESRQPDTGRSSGGVHPEVQPTASKRIRSLVRELFGSFPTWNQSDLSLGGTML